MSSNKRIKNCPDCREPGDFFSSGDGICKECWGSGTDWGKQIANIPGDIVLETLGMDDDGSDESCDVCSGTKQCQTCGGTGEIHVDDDNDEDDFDNSVSNESNSDSNSKSSSDLDNYDFSDSDEFSYTSSKKRTSSSENYSTGCLVLIVLVIGVLGYYGYKSFDSKPEKKQIAPTTTSINRVGYINIRSGVVNVRQGSSTEYPISYTLKRFDRVHVQSQNISTKWYRITNSRSRLGYIPSEYVTFDINSLRSYNGKFYKEFYSKSISLNSETRKSVLDILISLKEYSDDFEILTYDYLNQEAAAIHRAQQIRGLIHKSGLINNFETKYIRWNEKTPKWKNLIIIKSKTN